MIHAQQLYRRPALVSRHPLSVLALLAELCRVTLQSSPRNYIKSNMSPAALPSDSRLSQAQVKVRLPAFKDLPLKPEYPPHAAWSVWGDKDELGTVVSGMVREWRG